MKLNVEYRLNILDIVAIIVSITAIIVSIYIAYHVDNLKEMEKHLREIKEIVKK